MTEKSNDELGLRRLITRRDLIHDTALTALAAGLLPRAYASQPGRDPGVYPPTRTGLRGSHTGSFEVGHALRDGVQFKEAADTGEDYDLVVVGGGISGLAAAHYYRKRFGEQSRILILENHDDFGGHARRNEFHVDDIMRLSMGGTHNLEHWQFSDIVRELISELGIDVEQMRNNMQFDYGFSARNGSSIWFDSATYGVNKLVTNYTLESWRPGDSLACIDEFPLSETARTQLKNLYSKNTNVLAHLGPAEAENLLTRISYPDFLRQYAGLSEEAIQVFHTSQHGAWGVQLRALSAMEGFESGLPGLNLVGAAEKMQSRDYPVAMFPDGNASIARLLVSRLIPAVSPGATVDNIAVAPFNYDKLDQPGASVRLRLNATVVNLVQSASKVNATYVKEGRVQRLSAKHCVAACYHSILPYLCPEMPEEQKNAQKYQVKIPLVLANVLLRSSEPLDKLGIDHVNCPGRMLRDLFMFKGINTGGYTHRMEDAGPVPLVFWGSISPPDDAYTLKEQLRASRRLMQELTFKDFELEIRTVLNGLLAPGGFDVREDILAITVNRWPHGYAYEYMQLWDEKFEPGSAPHEIARRPFGRIAIANADAGASAYTHVAIDEAYRAVLEIKA